jgi:glycosyltransferase involved in cell wall biosynthesis
MEAMSFGLPTICFLDIPYEDIITHQEDGIVVKERTPEALATTIQLLIENKGVRKELGTKASNHVKRFEKQIIAQQVLAFMKIKQIRNKR